MRYLFGLITLTLVGMPLAAQEEPHPIAQAVKAAVKDANKPFTMLIAFKVKEGSESKFEQAFKPAIAATQKEKGCIAYQLNKDAKKPQEYVLYERWQRLADLEAHLKAPHVTKLLAEVGSELVGAPETRILVPAGE